MLNPTLNQQPERKLSENIGINKFRPKIKRQNTRELDRRAQRRGTWAIAAEMNEKFTSGGPVLTRDEETGFLYKNEMYLHPRVRPGWCLLILAIILVGIGGMLLLSSFVPNFQNSFTDNKLVMKTASYACFITGGILAACAGFYTYLNWTAVQRQLEMAKIKQDMIHNEIRKRSRKIISDSVKNHYRVHFDDLYDACMPMHRMEIPYGILDVQEDVENNRAIENINEETEKEFLNSSQVSQ